MPEKQALLENPTWNKPRGGAKVAVIGCGPGGMFVCHALETESLRLQEHLKAATTEEARGALEEKLHLLPSIVCLEQANSPGGVWRSTKNNNNNNSAGTKTDSSMYEALWCNGPKEVMEFPDYTFVDHFGKDSKLPLYLPRQAVLDYIMARVTRQCPQFFDQYARFQTRVEKVTYDSTTNRFTVVTLHLPTQTTTTAFYDKVIWSAGQNGSGKIPGPILHPFQDAQTKFSEQQQQQQSSPEILVTPPPFLHASSMEQKAAQQIQGRHLLLIGGSYSAEDLAFMGIKWGAQHVTILTRRHGIDVPVCWTSNWPDDRVTVLAGYVVDQVQVVQADNNNGATSYTVSLKKYAYEGSYEEVDETTKEDPTILPAHSATTVQERPPSPKSVVDRADSGEKKRIENVDVVVCCTGYKEHLEMLDKSCYNMSEEAYKQYWNGRDIMDLPADWTMAKNQLTGLVEKYFVEEDSDNEEESNKENNHMKKEVKKATKNTTTHIPPKRDNLYPGCYVNPYSYREFVFVHNPNLMWLAANNFDAPLLALDVQANYAIKFLTGQCKIPTLEQMKTENQQQALMEMEMPMVRYWMDTHYYNAIQKWLEDTTRKVHYLDDQGNRCTRYEYPKEWNEAYRQTSQWELFLLARLMEESDYPLQLGNLHELNKNGEQFMAINWGCRNYATCSKIGTTFRDVSAEQCDSIQSILTGAKPAPLNGRWLDMDDFAANPSDMVA